MMQNTNALTVEQATAKIINLPSSRLEGFEKTQVKVLETLEAGLTALKAEFLANETTLTKSYDGKLDDMRAKVKEWMELIKLTEDGIREVTADKKKHLEELSMKHETELKCQLQMIKFQREGLRNLRS